MKIVLLPLDERPCNYNYPLQLPLGKDIKIVLPPRELLSHHKNVCDVLKLHDWLKNECIDADYALISMDTLLYGGIVPSRLHHLSLDEITNRADVLKEIKKVNPNIKIFVNELIMRTPSYSNAIEEPDYFDICGYELWKHGVFLDKQEQGVITEEELLEMKENLQKIKPEYLEDLLSRRYKNRDAIIHNLKLYQEGIVDFFLIPQDDCHSYGFTSRDRRHILNFLKQENLLDKIIMHPGADEAGLTLISLALNDYHKTNLKMHVLYLDELGKNSIPLFEDRPVDQTISSHIKACGLVRVDNYQDADIVLIVNLADEFLPTGHEGYLDSLKHRDLSLLINTISKCKKDNKVVGIADLLLCNEGDITLFKTLFNEELLGVIDGYAGWNTSSNTLDTSICNLVSYYFSKDIASKELSLLYRYVEDVFYMGIVRKELNEKIQRHTEWKIHNQKLGYMRNSLEQYTKEKLENIAQKYQLSSLRAYKEFVVNFFWDRTFEIELLIR